MAQSGRKKPRIGESVAEKLLKLGNVGGAGHVCHYILQMVVEAPEKLGKYQILELLAQGGMAEVYKAKAVGIAGFEKVLAIKRIRPRYAKEPRFIRNFIDEARIAVTLNHRNIVQVFDFGKADGELFLAMELLEGVDLRVAVQTARKKGERLPAALACYVMSDVASGLDYAHRKSDNEGNPLGIVHCDVSPHNILLSNEGFVKILDFGVARARFVAAPTSKRLRGKPRYMAPEQTLGEAATFASDVFVVGILAWELLAGRPLFDGEDIRAILKSVRSDEIIDLAALRPDLPGYLCQAVMTALRRNASERGSAADIGVQLSRAGRELSDTTSAQALSEWLRTTFATGESPEQTQTEPAPPPTSRAPVSTVVASQDESVLDDEPQEETARHPSPRTNRPASTDPGESGPKTSLIDTRSPAAPTPPAEVAELESPSLSALLDKRRVVIAILLLDGGTEERRRELSLALCDLAYKRGAVVHERSENEVVAIFGLQLAGEDDVASAMHFAIDAGELTKETEPALGPRQDGVSLRSAARAGVVAQRREKDYQLRGDALREARELARGAEANRPLLSGGAGRLSSVQFRFRELPARRYRSRRLRVLELIGAASHDDRSRALRSRRGRFVGRQAELRTLWELYGRSVAEGGSRALIIEGAPGLGKSRLMAEFVAGLDDLPEPPRVIAIGSTDKAAAAPFTCAIEYLQAALKLPPKGGEDARNELLQRLAGVLRDGQSEEVVRERSHSIELAMELRDGALSRNEEAPAALRERCADTIAHFHAALCQGKHSVVILENFHQADAASMEVLQALLRRTPCEAGVLVVVTSRDESLAGTYPDAAVVRLADLEGRERSELIADRLADSGGAEVIEEVSRRAGGNPLFIEELCRTIREVGWDETPATVRDAVIARVERLSAGTRAVLQRAAVIGESFRAHILEELIGAPAAVHLQELIDEHLLVRSDEAEYEADGGEFSFRHGLIQEVVYASLSAGARLSTHANLGSLLALRSETGQEEPPALTAYHLEQGGDRARAAHYWIRAGHVAQTAFETVTARDCFARAITLLQAQVHGNESAAAPYIEALFGRARAFRDLGDFDSEGHDLSALETLCRDRPAEHAELLTRVAGRHLRNGAFDKALESAALAAQASQDANTPLMRGEALRIRGEALERMGEYAAGLDALNEALSIFEQLGARSLQTRARISMARNHLVRAHYEEARGIYQPILIEIGRNHDPWIERIANNHLAVIHLCLGEFESAMRCAQTSVRLCEQDGDQARAGDNLSVCGIILQEVGQFGAAEEYFRKALELSVATKSRWSYADCLVYAGYNHGLLGDLEAGLAEVEQARSEAEELKTPYIECNANLALAGLLLRRDAPGDRARAISACETVRRLAQEATLFGAEAMALSRQAESLRRMGNLEEGLRLSQSAMLILDRQRHLEGAEEEILFHHFLLLEALESPQAGSCLERAFSSLERKLDGIVDLDWRRSYCEDLVISAAILQAAEEQTV